MGQSQPWFHSKILLTKTKNQNQIIMTTTRDQAGPSKPWLHKEPIPAIRTPLWPGDLLNAFLFLLLHPGSCFCTNSGGDTIFKLLYEASRTE